MTNSVETPPWAGRSGTVRRGGLSGGAIGMTMGGVVGTAQWPVVGTFFIAIAGGFAGLIVGAFVGATLSVTVKRASRPMIQRFVGASAAATFIAVVHLARLWSATADPAGSALVAVVSIMVAGLASPLVVSGLPAARFRGAPLLDALARTVAFGIGLGGAVGALAGFGIGVLTQLPTSPAAAVEGGVLGGMSGCVLSLIVCAGFVAKTSFGPTRFDSTP